MRDGALAVGLGGEHHLLDARRAVEHRVLGVVVEVDEALSHQPDSFPSRAQTTRMGLHVSTAA